MVFGVDDMLFGAGISAIGSGISGLFNWNSQSETNEANAAQAQLNRDFQERMSNTAYQRGMADMKAAGLNPILAYQKGGASSPTGSQATMTAPKIEGNPLGEAVNTGLRVRQAAQDFANSQEQQRVLNADATLKTTQAAKNATENLIRQEELPVATREKLKAEADSEFYKSSAGRLARQVGTGAQEANRTVEPVMNSAKKLVDTVNPFRSFKTEKTTSGSSWKDPMTGENHYQSSTFNDRWKGW